MKLTTDNLRVEPALSGGAIVTFETVDLQYSPELLHKYEGKKISVEVKEKRGGRSLDANAYCWVLCDKIAQTKGLMATKTDVYKKAIKDYGVTSIVAISQDAVPAFIRDWKTRGYGNDVDVMGKMKEHPDHVWLRVYHGSSTYDTKEMSVLLDGIIADAKELDIDTMTPAEVEKLKSMWSE